MDKARHLRAVLFLALPHVDGFIAGLQRDIAEGELEAGMARVAKLVDHVWEPRTRQGLAEGTTVQRLRALWVVVGAHPTKGKTLQAEVTALAREWKGADGMRGRPIRRDIVLKILAWCDERREDVKRGLAGGMPDRSS